jgi:hypothetical protein
VPTETLQRETLKRFTDWEARLAGFILARRGMPFAWGTNDCALFVCDAIVALTGIDPALMFRGQYDNKLSALRALREEGHSDFEHAISRLCIRHAFEEIHPAMAQRGDVVVLDSEGGPTLGLLGLNGEIFTLEEEGGLLSIAALLDDGEPLARRAWRI